MSRIITALATLVRASYSDNAPSDSECDEYRSIVHAAKLEHDAVRVALRRYGRHLSHCAALIAPTDSEGSTMPVNACTCGLDNALRNYA